MLKNPTKRNPFELFRPNIKTKDYDYDYDYDTTINDYDYD